MGVCEGVPRAVLPDHMGKADYLGVCVNTAARCAGKGSGEGGGSVPAADVHLVVSFHNHVSCQQLQQQHLQLQLQQQQLPVSQGGGVFVAWLLA